MKGAIQKAEELAAKNPNSYILQQFEQLELKYAAKTDALDPPHRYVPWVVVDGEPLYEDYENFEAYICKAYKGNNRPEVCDGALLKLPKEKKPRNGVCHRNDIGLFDGMRIEMIV